MEPSFWEGRRVLVTGHTGFKGAWLTAWLERLGSDLHGIALDPLPGDMYPLVGLNAHRSTIADLRSSDIAGPVRDADPEVVFHLAAQATVQNGYRDPEGTFSTNVMGTLRLLESLRDAPSLKCVIVVTTDKVYGNEPKAFTETDRLAACDPYSGSKVCQELVVDTYRYSYFRGGPTIATARAGNVIGGGDNGANRLLPDCVRATSSGSGVKLRNPGAVRPWQHVLEPLRGYLMYAEEAARNSTVPSSLNFGPYAADTATVGKVAEEFLAQLTDAPPTITHDRSDPEMSENPCLTLDPAAAAPAVGWKPVLDRTTAVGWTAEWYAEALAGGDLRRATFDQIIAYEELAR